MLDKGMSEFMTFTEWMSMKDESFTNHNNAGVPHYANDKTPAIRDDAAAGADRADLRSMGWKRRARERFCRHMGVGSFKDLVGMKVNTKKGPGAISSSRQDTFSVQFDADGRKRVLAYSSAPYEGIEPQQPGQPASEPAPAINQPPAPGMTPGFSPTFNFGA